MGNSVKLGSSAILSALLGTSALIALPGCEGPPQDAFISQGGISPDPTARLDGAVVYIGPHPRCEYANGRPTRVIGRVFLTMFAYDNPPPPEGTATSALNVLTVSGDRLFPLSDCLPEGQGPDYTSRVTRSASFIWPRLPLKQGATSDLQIRGFYDYDEDLVPFFSTTNLPTAGDIVGAALNDIQDSTKGYLKITLPRFEDALNGVIVAGVNVTLGSPVWTERPAFKLDENRRLAANAPFPLDITSLAGGTLRAARALSCASGATDGATCGTTLLRLDAGDRSVLETAGVELALDDPSSYAFYTSMVDLRTVGATSVDVMKPDGVPDPHPFLSGLGVQWYYPFVLLQRAANATDNANAVRNETQAAIPRVLTVGSVLVDDMGSPTKGSYVQSGAPIAIAPVVAVELIANRPECRVPYFAPGTPDLVGGNRVAQCSELPTGRYSVNVFDGNAGGLRVPTTDTARNESGYTLTGGSFPGQSWSVPNDLANPLQLGEEGEENVAVLAHQGTDGMFVIHDPTPSSAATCTFPGAKGLCAEGVVDVNPNGLDSYSCLPTYCCDAITHLIGVPRCELDSNGISTSPKTVTPVVDAEGKTRYKPDCIPFDLPSICTQ